MCVCVYVWYVCVCVSFLSLCRATKGMGAVMEERLKRRCQKETAASGQEAAGGGNGVAAGTKLRDSRLVKVNYSSGGKRWRCSSWH